MRTQLLLSTLREDVARRPLDAEGVAAVAGAAGHTALSKVRTEPSLFKGIAEGVPVLARCKWTAEGKSFQALAQLPQLRTWC